MRLECIGGTLEGIHGVDERPRVDATVREQIERRDERAAARSDERDLVDDDRGQRQASLSVKRSKEIAEALGLHYRTVESRRAGISQKLGLQGSHALVKYAFEHKPELE